MPESRLAFADWAARQREARFTDWLRAGAEAPWQAMAAHRFVRDMASDALPEAAFERYLHQEHAFVRQAVRVFAHALVQAPTADDQRHVAVILDALTGEQERYFEAAYRRLGMAEAPVAPRAANHLANGALAVAAEGTFEEILALMLAAEWAYLEWCGAAHRCSPRRPEPAAWIALHVGGAFASGVAWTRSRLDTLGPQLDSRRQWRCRDAFREMLELEIEFHDAVYAAGDDRIRG